MTRDVQDIVGTYGLLTLGSRLKRIGERLQGDAGKIASAHGAQVAASQYPLLAALDQLGTATIGELAEAVGSAQPGVTRSIAELSRLGLVRSRRDHADARQRLISLTASGISEVAHARTEIWPLIEAAVADLCSTLKGPLLEQLTMLEMELAAAPLAQRIPPGKGKRDASSA